MKKIEIKLKECCLDCEHFDPSGCVGLNPAACYCGEPDRVIACGHMAVCKKYLELHPPSCCELERHEIILPKEGYPRDGGNEPEEGMEKPDLAHQLTDQELTADRKLVIG